MKAPALLLIGIIAATSARADWKPDEIGATVRAWHKSGAQLNDRTTGLYALWDFDEFRGIKVKALATVLRLSNNRDGVGAGVVAEADIATAASVFASATLMRGYQQTSYSYTPSPGSYVECITTCAHKTSRDVWTLVPAVGIAGRASGWVVRLSVQPGPKNGQPKYWQTRPDARSSRSALLTIGKVL